MNMTLNEWRRKVCFQNFPGDQLEIRLFMFRANDNPFVVLGQECIMIALDCKVYLNMCQYFVLYHEAR